MVRCMALRVVRLACNIIIHELDTVHKLMAFLRTLVVESDCVVQYVGTRSSRVISIYIYFIACMVHT
jgi:hypothetical protein